MSTSYKARIILDSIGPNEARITTFELTYPRFIHAELMTHRMFSRNSASSRAIPSEKLLSRIEADPAMPVFWGANQSGMQAKEELDTDHKVEAFRWWLIGRDEAVDTARKLAKIGLHKQIANRVVEPWMFITVILTATEFANMRSLRVDPNAQPEFEHIARKMFDCFDTSTPQKLDSGDWHLPLVTGNDESELRKAGHDWHHLAGISVGRCARVSYLTHEGKRDPKADLELCERLRISGHMSPFEHVAQAVTHEEWMAYAMKRAKLWAEERVPIGNFWGWKQYRKDLFNEHDFSQIKTKP